jgi:hypothetical protein
MKASARLSGSTLWKDEPHEGIDGRNPCGSGDSTNSSREQGPEGGHAVHVPSRGGAVAVGNAKRAWAPRGAPIASRRSP